MSTLNAPGFRTSTTDEYGPPLPSSNAIQELVRWCPHGVRHYLTNIARTEHLATAPTVILDWMTARGMTRIPTTGKHAGQIILSNDGQKVRTALVSKLAGKDT